MFVLWLMVVLLGGFMPPPNWLMAGFWAIVMLHTRHDPSDGIGPVHAFIWILDISCNLKIEEKSIFVIVIDQLFILQFIQFSGA